MNKLRHDITLQADTILAPVTTKNPRNHTSFAIVLKVARSENDDDADDDVSRNVNCLLNCNYD